MPQYKTLRSVVHSVAGSFVGDLDRQFDCYVMADLLDAARTAMCPTVTIDLLQGNVEPALPVSADVQRSIEWLAGHFATLVTKSNSSLSFIQAATLTIAYADSEEVAAGRYVWRYDLEVLVTDDRGKRYAAQRTAQFDSRPAPLRARRP